MSVATFVQPDFTSQTETALKTNYDHAASVFKRIADAFAAHEQATPNMTVALDAGFIPAAGALATEVAAQNTGTVTAPVANPRHDIVYVDQATGTVGIATGTEAASPADPAVPAGKVAIARINATVGMGSITNAILDDLRNLGLLGLGAAATKAFAAAGGVQDYDTAARQGKQTIWVPAEAMFPTTTAGCAAAVQAETTTNKVNRKYLAFDPATIQHANFRVRPPKSWDAGTITYIAIFEQASTSAGAVVHTLKAVAIGDGVAVDTAWGTGVDTTKTAGTVGTQYIGPESAAVTIGNSPAKGNDIFFDFSRNATAAGDTLAVNSWLLGLVLIFTTNAGNDA